MNFRAGTAGAGISHLPEIVFFSATDDASRRDAHLLPELLSVVVFTKDGDPQAGLIQSDRSSQKFPTKCDRVFLEIVSEREIPEHFEEGVMPPRVPDVLEVVVLAAGAQTLLRRDSPAIATGLLAEKDPLELVHAGVGEEQRWIGLWNQRRTRHGLVSMLLKVVNEGLPKVVCALCHDARSSPRQSLMIRSMVSSRKPRRRRRDSVRWRGVLPPPRPFRRSARRASASSSMPSRPSTMASSARVSPSPFAINSLLRQSRPIGRRASVVSTHRAA